MNKILNDLTKEFNNKNKNINLNESLIKSFIKNIYDLLIYDYLNNNTSNLESLYFISKKKLNKILIDLNINSKDIISNKFFNTLPVLRKSINTSIDALYNGDPASNSKEEIVLTYPGIKAIIYYRIAHEFYLLNVKILARFISEDAHKQTGIDINPGATIGDYFFIDHGTGIVIGETCIIGNNVKLYQGVTLGALSLSKGRLLNHTKRHPTIEDNVTIYSNACIYGGDTIIKKGSVIGGDVYLTHGVNENSIVLQTDKNLTIITKNKD